jgi:DNA adenine methylase
MKSPLKWVGGKQQIISNVLELYPKTMNNYHEPFLGGGTVLLSVLSNENIHITGKVYASDLNKHIIDFYTLIQTNPEKLIRDTRRLIEEFRQATGDVVNRSPKTLEEAMTSEESYYYWIRSQFNKSPTSSMFLFLNKTCFRGVYREGPNGFNVPFGHNKNPGIIDDEHIRSLSRLIRDVVFTHGSFTDTLQRVATPDDFVYLDPPYAPENSTSFTSYTVSGFSAEMHNELFRMARELPCVFLMSNSDVQLVRDSFKEPEFTTRIISCRRAINSKSPESRTNEVLITK